MLNLRGLMDLYAELEVVMARHLGTSALDARGKFLASIAQTGVPARQKRGSVEHANQR